MVVKTKLQYEELQKKPKQSYDLWSMKMDKYEKIEIAGIWLATVILAVCWIIGSTQ